MATKVKKTEEIEVKESTIKGIDESVYEVAKNIIVSGFQNGADEAQIKTEMVKNDIPFNQLLRLYKTITVSEKLVLSPEDIKAAIAELVAAIEFSNEQIAEGIKYEFFAPVIAHAIETIKGATEKKVIAQIRDMVEGKDLVMPKKPKAKKGGAGKATSKINSAIVDLFVGNKDATAEEFDVAVNAVTTEKSAKKWARMYKMFSAIATGKNASQGLA